MKLLAKLSLILFFYFSLAACAVAQKPTVKILPLGDSITCASKYKLSYRYPLWKKLVDARKQIKFIGSHAAKGDYGRTQWDTYKNLSFPPAHECHPGWRTDQILNGLNKDGSRLSQWIAGYQADIALIHLGTNDIYQSQTAESTRDEIEQVILTLRTKNPYIKILLARIIPMQMNPNIPRLNQLLLKLSKKLNKPDSPVISVDMYSGFSVNTDMQKDKIHPNAKGEEKMAQRWFTALVGKRIMGQN